MRISTDKFNHDKAKKIFSAEASELPFGWINGVTLVSPRNSTASFFLKETHYDQSHEDVLYWEFGCSTNPKAAGYQLVIYND